MKFWKMNGTGNDFIVINNIEEKIDEKKLSSLASILCKRHLSIGADGLMAVEKTQHNDHKADFRMLYYNSDGSLGEMCGNGARCLARYGYENGLCKGGKISIETTAGLVTASRLDRINYKIRLNDSKLVMPDISLNISIGSDSEDVDINCSYVELGDPPLPHLVVIYDKSLVRILKSPHLKTADKDLLYSLGKKLRSHPKLPKGANVNFVGVNGNNKFYIRTFERGVEDFTYSCGTGTASSACILALKGMADTYGIVFCTEGGSLSVDIERIDNKRIDNISFHGIDLSGPTNIVSKGEITDDNISFFKEAVGNLGKR